LLTVTAGYPSGCCIGCLRNPCQCDDGRKVAGILQPVLPTTVAEREQIPLCTGCLDYFPLALAAVAHCSQRANEQHNPGQEMHWARGKSMAHADKILKHLTDRGTIDTDGIRHSTKLAWRALALLQEELEAAGGLPGRGAKFPDTTTKEI